jgi:ubiquinone/menaquinone biosynthesis C-methylase UbiE
MSVWGRVFATMYDRMMAGPEKAGLREHRQQLLSSARGRVLEIGGGTGANLAFYGDQVQKLTVTEPEPPMARRVQERLGENGAAREFVQAPAEMLPFEDGSFDTAVSTLVLCTVEDQPRALAELRRVLVPGGRLLFIEHVRSEQPRLARWQDRLNWLNRKMGHGCNCNRSTLEGIRAAGFNVVDVAHDRLRKVPPLVRPLVVGSAAAGSGEAAA